MRLSPFLAELFEHGHVRVDRLPADPQEAIADEADREAASRLLIEREQIVAADFPSAPPAIDLPAALWAAAQFYRACSFVFSRDATADVLRRQLTGAPPPGEPASQQYSVDLVWRFLPDLDRLTATLAPEDPLRRVLREWGADWPLSSVGMKNIEPRRVEELLAHPGLRQAYVDRVVAARDSSRLGVAVVRDLAQAALGAERWRGASWARMIPTAAPVLEPPAGNFPSPANDF